MQRDRLLYHLSHHLVGSAPRKRQIALTMWPLKAHNASRAVVLSLALCDGGPVHDRVEFPFAIAVEPMPDDPGGGGLEGSDACVGGELRVVGGPTGGRRPKMPARAPAVSRSIPHRRVKRWKSCLSEGPYPPRRFVGLLGRQAQPAGQMPDGGCALLSWLVSRSRVPLQRPQADLAVELIQLVPCFVESKAPCSRLCASTPIVISVHLTLADTNDLQSFGADRTLSGR